MNVGRELGQPDAIILQRKLLPRFEMNLLRRRASRLIFDFDDAVWLRDSYSRKGLHDPRRSRRLQNILSRCDAVTAGNLFLADYASHWVKNGLIRVIPTCVNVDRYLQASHDRPPGQATLVWIGSSSTLRGLEAIQPMLERIGEHFPGVELKLVCDRFLNLRHLPVVAEPWSEETEAAAIASSDIGISWVPDDCWSLGKCGLKILQYMAAGLPVVANPVGVQATMIRHGETGFLATTEAEWIDAIQTLAGDPALRRRMGQSGRRVVEERYSVSAGAEHWASLLNSLEQERRAA